MRRLRGVLLPTPTTIWPNPTVPVLVDPVTGTVYLPVDRGDGSAVLAETKVAGDLFEVPAGTTLEGFVVLLVAGTAGSVSVVDGSSTVLARVGPGAVVGPVTPSVVSVVSAGGDGGNQLSVDVSGGATLVSATVAGYFK